MQPGEAVAEANAGAAPFDLEELFRARYATIARVIANIVRDTARAEELAVEVFLRLPRRGRVESDATDAWLYRTAVRIGLDELRREGRRRRYERLLTFFRGQPTPEDIRVAGERRERVRVVLGTLRARDAELLLLRAGGLSYQELAEALSLHAASTGTLLARAQQSFRKEYIRRYGEQY